jgi:adenylosuccinate lyase
VESRPLYANLSPLDHRYSISEPALFARLSLHLSEEAVIRSCARVEEALLVALIRRLVPAPRRDALAASVAGLATAVDPGEVYAEEARTRHNVRALVNVIRRRVPPEAVPYVHLGATSVDILDTAASLRYRDAVRGVLLPLLADLEESLVRLARAEADTPQIGRTHGQHAVPITFGFAVAGYASRLGKCILRIRDRAADLRGKLSGAVGAYNAASLLVRDPEALEAEFLAGLGLHASDTATQLVEPEHLLGLLLEINTCFGVVANIADDLRHLQRSEIAEVREEFAEDQVGSSTMPQKRNPWNAEHVKSLWKAFAPRVVTFFLDQVSEHQRDLTNSASGRFVADYLAGFAFAVARTVSVIGSLTVDRGAMAGNLRRAGDLAFAEAVYVLAARGGERDAHERVRQATLRVEREGKPLREVLEGDPALWKALDAGLRASVGCDAAEFFGDPERYTGRAASRARATADRWEAAMAELRKELEA